MTETATMTNDERIVLVEKAIKLQLVTSVSDAASIDDDELLELVTAKETGADDLDPPKPAAEAVEPKKNILQELRAKQAARKAAEPKPAKAEKIESAAKLFNQQEFSERVVAEIAKYVGADQMQLDKKKLTIADDDMQFMILGQRLTCYKKDGDNIMLVIEHGGEAYTVRAGVWLDSGPRITNSWRDLEYYVGGAPTVKFFGKMQKLSEFLEVEYPA